ncbi:MAG: hypothetical protein WCJ58_01480 [bacterium]
MAKVRFNINKITAGFSSIEVLLAISIFALLSLGVASALAYGVQSTADQSKNISANYLANENIEAVSNISEPNFATLTNGDFHITTSGNTWGLVSGAETIYGYTRKLTIANGPDLNTKQVTSQVSWVNGTQTKTVTLVKYLTNWKRSVAVAGNWALATREWTTNVSTATPVSVRALGTTYAVVIYGSGATNFVVYNYSNPAAITVASSLALPATLIDLYLDGNYAYVTSSANASEFMVINLSTPTAAALIGTVDLAGSTDPTRISVSGNIVAVGRQNNGGTNEVAFINVATKNSPVLIREITNLNIAANDVYINGNYLYIATSTTTREIVVYNITNILTTNPVWLTDFDLSGNNTATHLAYGNGSLFVYYSGTGNIRVVTLPTATTFTEVATMIHGTIVYEMDYVDTLKYLFVASSTGTKQFAVYNVATPASPSLVIGLNNTTLFGLDYLPVADKVLGIGNTGGNSSLQVFKPN